MSAAAADPKAKPGARGDAEPAPAKVGVGKKKLIIIGAVLALLLAAGGGAAVFLMKKRAAAAAAAAEEEGGAAAKADAPPPKAPKADLKHAPAFVPLDPFTVNLADREAERYAQVGITLELVDAKAGDLLKAYMPAIRNNLLLVLAGKTANQMMDHEGKLQLAAEIRAAALKPLGYDVKASRAAASGAAKPASTDDDDVPPIKAVHFSNFIIQ
ncbi:MAG TPA: flagellar basal body-associated FliL family protein [Burkholderiaceae bacterium]|nr:flagellar basal body-associated FliL family protein [Burkholderiaceae bacterium]